MILEGYDIVLRRISKDDIETIRIWRNDPRISQYMEFREHITPEMQEKWFDKINNQYNYYFIIEVQNEGVGLINIKDIDYEHMKGEAGIFIYDTKYLNSDISFKSFLVLYDYFFNTFKLKYTLAHILESNKRAIRFNKFFGYENYKDQQEYILYADVYKQYSQKIKKMLAV